MLYPFIFQPIFKERVWGGREIERLFGNPLPPGKAIGEAWEISDRPGDQSIIQNGEYAGNTLRWLMEHFSREILGEAKAAPGNRFPILCKILDAREKLSLQVHPPADQAAELKGEPKTEFWFVADALPGAELYAGLARGATRPEFEEKYSRGAVAECFHRIPVRAGDAMFLPSGRAHAIGAGLVIFEIQQNSDTTYRLFDWNRLGTDGKPRELHVKQSLASIDFGDFEPQPVTRRLAGRGKVKSRMLVSDPLFDIEQFEMKAGARHRLGPKKMQIAAVVAGRVEMKYAGGTMELHAGQFCLVPAILEQSEIMATADSTWLRVEAN
ncbi:MAG: type I phosphomannose isomerase catalytic subunit [Limisphaerales bacterium]